MRFRRIELHTHRLAEQQSFYTQTLGLPLLAASPTAFTVQAGETSLTFAQAAPDTRPYYHLAFNIPENQIAEAKDWLRARAAVRNDETVVFDSWNAHALYFHDPAENILELIARHNLPNRSAEPFTGAGLLNISEIGLPAASVSDTCAALTDQLHVPRWRPGDAAFCPMGDEHGLFIVVRLGRPWFQDGKPAAYFPISVTMAGDRGDSLEWSAGPYHLCRREGLLE